MASKFTAGHAGTSGTISFDARISTNQSIRATKNFTVNARQEMHDLRRARPAR